MIDEGVASLGASLPSSLPLQSTPYIYSILEKCRIPATSSMGLAKCQEDLFLLVSNICQAGSQTVIHRDVPTDLTISGGGRIETVLLLDYCC